MSAQVLELLATAGVPADALTDRRHTLPPATQSLHRRILEHLVANGTPPSADQLSGWAAEVGADLPAALQTLADSELLFLDPDGAVTGGVPFAAGHTAHQVHIAGGPVVAANCAVDALGIPAMLHRDAAISSRDPQTGEAVTATSTDGQWSWTPDQAVVFLGSTGTGLVTDTCCPAINFFASADNARAYQQRHDLTGITLPMPDAAQVGGFVFGGLLDANSAAPLDDADNQTNRRLS